MTEYQSGVTFLTGIKTDVLVPTLSAMATKHELPLLGFVPLVRVLVSLAPVPVGVDAVTTPEQFAFLPRSFRLCKTCMRHLQAIKLRAIVSFCSVECFRVAATRLNSWSADRRCEIGSAEKRNEACASIRGQDIGMDASALVWPTGRGR
jgi:hypothetical protein